MIGQKINNRYKIISQLGEGGMGEVYLANDEKNNQQVAVKILVRQLTANLEALERFKREGETLRQLDHPNIVKFIDAFEYEKQYIIVMEYISGGSLQNLIKKGQLPIEQARQITLDLCDALIRAHRLSIIHRDIKPENVLITENGTPKLADFGVARLSESTSMTRSGTQVGTPYYMAPEAWEGKTLDVQADIWSLGVMLFEMLTGQVPFGGDTGAAVMNKVLTAQPPDLKKLRGEVPTNLIKIIRQMLTRDKNSRYQTMRQVAADLEGGTITHSKSFTSRKTNPTSIFVALGIVITIGLSIAIFNSKNSSTLSNPEPSLSPEQKLADETVSPASTSLTQITNTPSELGLSIPTAIVKDSEKIFYDQFEENEHDGDFNRSLWIAKSSSCTIKQTGGALQIVNNPKASHQECDLYAGRPTTLQPADQLGVFEVQAMISSDYNRKSIVTQEIFYRTDSGSWIAICGLMAQGSSDVEGFMNVGGNTPDDYQDYYGAISLKDGFDAWNTVRLEIDPKTLAVSCLVDGQLIGAVTPRDAELLASAQLTRVIQAARGNQAFATSYVDNVYFETPPVVSWEFNTDGDLETWGFQYWQLDGLKDLNVKNGILSAITTKPDVRIEASEGIDIDTSKSSKIEIRMKLSAGKMAVFYFTTLESNDWSENQGKYFNIFPDNEFHIYTISMETVGSWEGILNRLRLDIREASGAIVEIDYIRLYP